MRAKPMHVITAVLALAAATAVAALPATCYAIGAGTAAVIDIISRSL
ncbi:hypothetical protein [Arthrobacter sp. A2-55]|nr:hypothetical protein [Arthrobacter sp. A2-55]MCU6481306.1 hypothetical protein [Arthrobacter sp. A2-55]